MPTLSSVQHGGAACPEGLRLLRGLSERSPAHTRTEVVQLNPPLLDRLLAHLAHSLDKQVVDRLGLNWFRHWTEIDRRVQAQLTTVLPRECSPREINDVRRTIANDNAIEYLPLLKTG